MKKIILITGGQRSGKSRYAERLALSLSTEPIYVATSRIWDEEHRQRIEYHKTTRTEAWITIEDEKYLGNHDFSGKVVLIDCITLWATNFFFDLQSDVELSLSSLKTEFDKLAKQNAHFLFVTNEIGLGEMSANEIQRRFTDLQGWFNQYLAERADEVVMMICGIPLKIK